MEAASASTALSALMGIWVVCDTPMTRWVHSATTARSLRNEQVLVQDVLHCALYSSQPLHSAQEAGRR